MGIPHQPLKLARLPFRQAPSKMRFHYAGRSKIFGRFLSIGRAEGSRTPTLAHEGLSFACLPFHHGPYKLAVERGIEPRTVSGDRFRDGAGPCPSLPRYSRREPG